MVISTAPNLLKKVTGQREREREREREATKIVTEKMTYKSCYTVHMCVN